MKRIFIIALSLLMAACLCVSLTSCLFLSYSNGTTVSDAEMSKIAVIPEQDEYVLPEGYKEYNEGKIYFAYPDEWIIQDGSVVIIVNESGIGNNITLSYEVYSDLYVTITPEKFDELVSPTYESMGATVSGVTIKQVTNKNSVAITQIAYFMSLNGVNMEQTMFIFPADNKNYVVTVTEAEPDSELVDTVFNSIRVDK